MRATSKSSNSPNVPNGSKQHNEPNSNNGSSAAMVKPMIAFLMSSITASLMPLYNRAEYLMMANILAILFWMFFITGIIFAALIKSKKRIQRFGKNSVFVKSKTKIVFDIAIVIAIISTCAVVMLKINISWIQSLLLFFFLFTIEVRCVLALTGTKKSLGKRHIDKMR